MANIVRIVTTLSVVLAGGVFVASAAASPVAEASQTCNINGQQRKFGHNMYLDALSVRRNSCRTGKAVVKGYAKCRYKHGGLNGRCPNRIQKYKCREGRRTVAPHIQYSATVKCQRGASRTIKFTYTQQI
jgi:hypothetical protein